MRRLLIAGLVASVAALMIPAVSEASTPRKGPAPKPSAGCRHGEPVNPGEQQITLRSDDVDRWYLRHIPPGYDASTPMPLVIDLHGYLEGATIHAIHSKLGEYGDSHGFITLTPNGTGDPIHWEITIGSPDVRFIKRLMDEAERTLCVDERRIYLTGLSNGSMFASALACVLTDRIAAIGTVSGLRDPKGCKPARPIPIVAFHGTADQVLSFDGGLGPIGLNLPTPDGRTLGEVRPGLATGKSIPQIAAVWAKRNGCRRKPKKEQIAQDVIRLHYSSCDENATVDLYEIIDGGHTWPGSEFSRALENVIGHVTFSINADDVIWKFFEAHPLKG